MKLARSCEILVGAVFLIAALGKAFDVPGFVFVIRAYGIARGSMEVATAAYALIGLETLLGAMLVSGIRLGGSVAIASALLLVMMSVLLGIGWLKQEPLPCGCFGVFGETGRPVAMGKNVVMLGMVATGWWRLRTVKDVPSRWRTAWRGIATASVCGVLLAASLSPKPVVRGELKQPVAQSTGGEGK
ncbi:MAG: hypothetical protein AMXMBFR84_14920 [Candidatus Hydrogenedentota bacterium]